MGHFKATAAIFTLVITLLSCQIGPEEPDALDLTDMEKRLAGDWRLRELIVNSDTFNIIGPDFEPYQPSEAFYHVKFRWFRYSMDRSYQFRWEIGDPNLVIGDSINYQPSYGIWSIKDNSMTHNEFSGYKTVYNIIELSDTLLIREYERTVIFADQRDSLKWKPGDIVTYREILVPRDE